MALIVVIVRFYYAFIQPIQQKKFTTQGQFTKQKLVGLN